MATYCHQVQRRWEGGAGLVIGLVAQALLFVVLIVPLVLAATAFYVACLLGVVGYGLQLLSHGPGAGVKFVGCLCTVCLCPTLLPFSVTAMRSFAGALKLRPKLSVRQAELALWDARRAEAQVRLATEALKAQQAGVFLARNDADHLRRLSA